jgi:hypothetical protein
MESSRAMPRQSIFRRQLRWCQVRMPEIRCRSARSAAAVSRALALLSERRRRCYRKAACLALPALGAACAVLLFLVAASRAVSLLENPEPRKISKQPQVAAPAARQRAYTLTNAAEDLASWRDQLSTNFARHKTVGSVLGSNEPDFAEMPSDRSAFWPGPGSLSLELAGQTSSSCEKGAWRTMFNPTPAPAAEIPWCAADAAGRI